MYCQRVRLNIELDPPVLVTLYCLSAIVTGRVSQLFQLHRLHASVCSAATEQFSWRTEYILAIVRRIFAQAVVQLQPHRLDASTYSAATKQSSWQTKQQ